MVGLVPATHAFGEILVRFSKQGVDARDERGQDDGETAHTHRGTAPSMTPHIIGSGLAGVPAAAHYPAK